MKAQRRRYQLIINGIIKATKITFISLVVILTIAISYTMIFPQKVDNATIQLSKVDFKNEICPEEVSAMLNALKKTDGVQSVHYFDTSNSMVTAFDNRVLSMTQIFEKIKSQSSVELIPVTTQNFPKSGGCPIHNNKILSNILTLFHQII